MLCLASFGCKKGSTDYYPWKKSTTFCFTARNQSVNVSPTTTSFSLAANYVSDSETKTEYVIVVIPEKTTAVSGEHYTLPNTEELYVTFPARNTRGTLEVGLIPEKITKQLTIAFTAKRKYSETDYKKYDDTTIVTLIPVI